jgi:hypothetical protein
MPDRLYSRSLLVVAAAVVVICFSDLGFMPADRLAAAESESPWRLLFDGNTLAGWEGDTTVFRVADSAITAGSLEQKNPRNEFLCTTREYADFELRLKFKLLGQGANAGIQIRSRRIPNHHEMIGYQADLGDKYWGCLYDESRRKKILVQADMDAVARVLRRDDWNDYRILAVGRHVQLWINDLATVDYTEADESLEQTGLIGLQIHGGPPSQVWYKEIEIREIK